MNKIPLITVLIATYNRSEDISKTLESLVETDRSDIDVEIVVIDNNSSDNTRQVVEIYLDKLPLTYLFQPVPGKNNALNLALEKVELGDIIAFTDDDVDFPKNWFHSVQSACQRHPDFDVFGGKITPVFPQGHEIPEWAKCRPRFGGADFAVHNFGNDDIPYWGSEVSLNGVTPFGANMWCRKKIFTDGLTFNGSIGPAPKTKGKGSETSFLEDCKTHGYKGVYIGDNEVGHRLQPKLLDYSFQMQRSFQMGVGRVLCAGSIWPEGKFKLARWLIQRLIRSGVIGIRALQTFFTIDGGMRKAKFLGMANYIGTETTIWKLAFHRGNTEK